MYEYKKELSKINQKQINQISRQQTERSYYHKPPQIKID